METAAQALVEIQGFLIIGFIVFLRVGAAAAIMPAFGERVVPIRVRLVLALGFTLIVAPGAIPLVTDLTNPPRWGVILATESIAGLAIGLTLRLFVLVLSITGSMAAAATSLAQIFGGHGADPLPAIGHIMVISGLALAAMLGLHVKITMLFLLSYDILPPGQFPNAADLVPWGVAQVANAFALAFTLAAPFIIAALVYNLALGVINKAMPQLMVAFVGAPAITMGGLVILALSLPLILTVWSGRFDLFLVAPFGAQP
ncbi:flagellar biosynthetic protein FliR [Oceaniglobus ichthyenteri]|uniref:flagellar biosynthetic protein FliR n=1 Tax=Oceaniglobus ichthyenteri TaxID=2136177 RepID=UPI000D3A814C|nr:flagellar biosynthetic protein FliR [Oceaniglobus ichthyenteri]